MQSDPKPYRPGQWIVVGTALGAFIGLVLGKFAIGLIFGLLVGIVIDSAKRTASRADHERRTDEDAKG